MKAEVRMDLAPPRPTARLVLGLLVILLGVIFALDNMNIFEAQHVLRFWPVVLVVIGLWRIVEARGSGSRVVGFLLLGLGLLFLANRLLRWWGFGFEVDDLWPLALVALGLRLVWGAFHRAGAARETAADGTVEAETLEGSTVSAFAFMGGNGVKVGSQRFAGGEALAVMGGCEIDLRDASTAGGEAVLDVFAMWGGIEIHAPEGWVVESRVLPVMGAFEDNTRVRGGEGANRLVVRGLVLMGGIEVNHGEAKA